MEDQIQDEQQSFQALKNKWEQQEKSIEQAQSQSSTSPPNLRPTTQPIHNAPPPVPPKPSLISLNKANLEEDSKRVSQLAYQFEKQTDNVTTTLDNVSNISLIDSEHEDDSAHPAAKISVLRKPPPPPPTPPIVHSLPISNNDPFTVTPTTTTTIKSNLEENIVDDNTYDDDEESEESDEAYMPSVSSFDSNSNNEGDNNLIEEVHRAQLQYTKSKTPPFVGAPGVQDQPLPSDTVTNKKTHRRPPPPPPPSKKYHTSVRAIIPSTTAAPPTAAPIVQPPQPSPPPVVDIPLGSSHKSLVEAAVISSPPPPLLPPRPIATPQLPPRPSQSTLARAHTISAAHLPQLNKSPPLDLIYTAEPHTLSEDDDDEQLSHRPPTAIKRANSISATKRAVSRSELLMTSTTYPYFSQATRNAPLIVSDKPFSTGHKGSIQALATCRNSVITGSNVLRTWDIYSGEVLSTIVLSTDGSANGTSSPNTEYNDKIRAVAIAPTRSPLDEGRYIWIARQDTMLCVVEMYNRTYRVLGKRHDLHVAPITFILRYGNTEIWTIDQGGVLCVWDVSDADYANNQNPLFGMPRRYHVTDRAVTAVIYGSQLWMSAGRKLCVHTIPVATEVGNMETLSGTSVRIPNDLGNIRKLVTIPYHPYRIFAAHDDGKVSIWDSKTLERIQVITVSMYGICSMVTVGEYHVWAGYNTGMIYVYDTRPENWTVLKMWKAHTGAVTQLVVDEKSLLLDEIRGRLQVVSGDSNGFVGVWDGLLTEQWKDDYLQRRAKEYCTYDEVRVMICSWNIDANKPEKICDEDKRAVREWLGTMEDPDVIVVGIQEIVDLESKKQTARSLFFKKKVDPNETEDVLTHRYKLWHDYLVEVIKSNYGANSYTVIKTDQLVGLFSCVFVRTTDLDRVFNIDSTSVKTGLKVMNKSIHGNKGGIAIRFVYDHSSLCFVNCHLAAGQSHVPQRNADAEGILHSASFPRHDYADVFTHGGDGSMIMDHEFCFLSGDLNYRIKMSRNDVLKILTNSDKLAAWEELQKEDQLLQQKQTNPLFKLLTFEEAPIHFDPTYKYDPGTDFYDRSEKKRVPAWCDRVLFKGREITNLYYRRYEARCSDHRPISAGFSIKTKVTDQKLRDKLVSKIDDEWREHLDQFVRDKKTRYVADYERCTLSEAFSLLEKNDWDVSSVIIKLMLQ
ncbi:MAG: Endonuclease/exonuclease/phosphatase [Benjaminiella poitrasii]|nr:MAG: Endonuclease/exonuclease/phosphatase [Benjaminiella poitrasii]